MLCHFLFQSRWYQPKIGSLVTVKCNLKYLRRTRNYLLFYSSGDLILIGYKISNFQVDKDSPRSKFELVFTPNRRAILWRSMKQDYIADPIIEAKYIATCEEINKWRYLATEVLNRFGSWYKYGLATSTIFW